MSRMPCKVGFTCGSFDLLHAGHVLMLEEARRECDHLIVGVQIDPTLDRPDKNKPIQSLEERITVLRGIRWVDEIRTYSTEEELYNMLEAMVPEVRILGADWKGKQYTGHDLGHKVFFNSRDHGWSSSDLRRRVYEAELSKINKEK
jgi:glycerol-3-phosphate cytidylyltransferase